MDVARIKDQVDGKKLLTPGEEVEAALAECKFGKFHIRLLVAVVFGSLANVNVSGNTAYLLPNAECDLGMTIMQKGILNAAPYFGMLGSGFFAGFLTDTFGRKVFLVYGYLGMVLCCIIEGSSQNYETLLAGKFFEGFLFSAAFNASIANISEFTHKNIRDRMMLFASSIIAIGHAIIALFSWAILPQGWHFRFFGGAFVLNSWNIYLYLSGLWGLTACIMYCFLPESPKFLVAHGRYREALDILRKIYKENTGKHVECFTVKSLGTSQNSYSATCLRSLNEQTFISRILTGLIDIKPMFKRPLCLYLILICLMQVMTMLAYNVLRLWYPQLSTIIEQYYKEYKRTDNLCLMLDSYMAENSIIEANITLTGECIQYRSGAETYINSIIMGGICIIPYIIIGALVNRVGKKLLLVVALSTCCACITSLSWAVSSLEVVAFVSTTVALTQTCVSLLHTIVVDVFPTTMKSLAISLMMMAGRIGTLVGNILFPVMLAQGCVVPFFTIAGMLFCVAVLSALLPTAQKK